MAEAAGPPGGESGSQVRFPSMSAEQARGAEAGPHEAGSGSQLGLPGEDARQAGVTGDDQFQVLPGHVDLGSKVEDLEQRCNELTKERDDLSSAVEEFRRKVDEKNDVLEQSQQAQKKDQQTIDALTLQLEESRKNTRDEREKLRDRGTELAAEQAGRKEMEHRLEHLLHRALPALNENLVVRIGEISLAQGGSGEKVSRLKRLTGTIRALRTLGDCVNLEALRPKLDRVQDPVKRKKLELALDGIAGIGRVADGKLNKLFDLEVAGGQIADPPADPAAFQSWAKELLVTLEERVAHSLAGFWEKRDGWPAGFVEQLDTMLRDHLLYDPLSNFFVARMTLEGELPEDLARDLVVIENEICAFLKAAYQLKPQEIRLRKAFSDTEFHRRDRIPYRECPEIGAGNIASVSRWGYLSADSSRVFSPADVAVVDEPQP